MFPAPRPSNPFPGAWALVTQGLRQESPDLTPLVGPSGSRPGSGAGRGRGQSWGKAGQEGGELCGQGAAEHSCAVPERPIAGSRPFSPRPRWSPQWSCSCSSWLNKQVRVWAVGPRAGPRVRAEGLRLRAEAGEDGKRLAGGRRAQTDPETLRMVPSGPCQGTRVLVPCFHVSSLFQG